MTAFVFVASDSTELSFLLMLDKKSHSCTGLLLENLLPQNVFCCRQKMGRWIVVRTKFGQKQFEDLT